MIYKNGGGGIGASAGSAAASIVTSFPQEQPLAVLENLSDTGINSNSRNNNSKNKFIKFNSSDNYKKVGGGKNGNENITKFPSIVTKNSENENEDS